MFNRIVASPENVPLYEYCRLVWKPSNDNTTCTVTCCCYCY